MASEPRKEHGQEAARRQREYMEQHFIGWVERTQKGGVIMGEKRTAQEAIDQLIVQQAELIGHMIEGGINSSRPNDVISDEYKSAVRALNETVRSYASIIEKN